MAKKKIDKSKLFVRIIAGAMVVFMVGASVIGVVASLIRG